YILVRPSRLPFDKLRVAPQDEDRCASLKQTRGLDGCLLTRIETSADRVRSTHLPHPEVRARNIVAECHVLRGRASKDAPSRIEGEASARAEAPSPRSRSSFPAR